MVFIRILGSQCSHPPGKIVLNPVGSGELSTKSEGHICLKIGLAVKLKVAKRTKRVSFGFCEFWEHALLLCVSQKAALLSNWFVLTCDFVFTMASCLRGGRTSTRAEETEQVLVCRRADLSQTSGVELSPDLWRRFHRPHSSGEYGNHLVQSLPSFRRMIFSRLSCGKPWTNRFSCKFSFPWVKTST